jgi:hypothetical protein
MASTARPLSGFIQEEQQFPHHLPQRWPLLWMGNGTEGASCEAGRKTSISF